MGVSYKTSRDKIRGLAVKLFALKDGGVSGNIFPDSQDSLPLVRFKQNYNKAAI